MIYRPPFSSFAILILHSHGDIAMPLHFNADANVAPPYLGDSPPRLLSRHATPAWPTAMRLHARSLPDAADLLRRSRRPSTSAIRFTLAIFQLRLSLRQAFMPPLVDSRRFRGHELRAACLSFWPASSSRPMSSAGFKILATAGLCVIR